MAFIFPFTLYIVFCFILYIVFFSPLSVKPKRVYIIHNARSLDASAASPSSFVPDTARDVLLKNRKHV